MPPAPGTSPLDQAIERSRHCRNVVQVKVFNLGHAAGYEKMQHARLVTAAVLEFIEAQAELEALIVAAIGELQARAPQPGHVPGRDL